MFVSKYSEGISRCCDGCGSFWEISDSPCDSLVEITFIHGGHVDLCGECALQLANEICDILGKKRIDPSSESYKAGYRDGFKNNYELKD